MKIEKLVVQACCKQKQIIFKLDRHTDSSILDFLKKNGFNEAAHFTKAGMIYADSPNLIVTAPLGGDRLNIKCKKNDCDQILNDFEALITQIP